MANVDVREPEVGSQGREPREPEEPHGAGFGSGVRAVIYELRRVVWPTRQELIRMTIVVVATVVIIATFIGVIDALLAAVFNAVYKKT